MQILWNFNYSRIEIISPFFFSCFLLLRIGENLEKKQNLTKLLYLRFNTNTILDQRKEQKLFIWFIFVTSGRWNKIMSIEMIIMNPQRSDWSAEEDVIVQHENLSTISKQNNVINDLDNNESKKSKWIDLTNYLINSNISLFCRLRSLCTFPCCQGAILGILTAGLLLTIVIGLWITSRHVTSTTSNINTQVSTSEFLFYMSDLWNTAMSISTALSMHRIQTFEFSAWLNFAQNRMRNRKTIEDLHWSWKSSYSFSINFV